MYLRYLDRSSSQRTETEESETVKKGICGVNGNTSTLGNEDTEWWETHTQIQ